LRVLKPSVWVFCVALLASLSVHLPVYEVLGVLAESVLNQPKAEPEASIVEFEMAPLPGTPFEEPLEPKDKPDPTLAPPTQPKPEEPKLAAKPKPEEKPEEKEVVEIKPEIQEAKTPEPPPTKIENQQAVTQKSDDPNVPPPENAQYIAEENRRVLEESVAQMRNMETDDAVQEPGTAQSASSEDKLGNASEDESAQDENVEGEKEAAAREIADATERPQTGEEQPPQEEAQQEPTPPQQVQHAVAGEQARKAEVPAEIEEVEINDGSGSFVIRRVKPVEGQGTERRQASDGAVARDGSPGVARPGRPNLKLSFSQYEDTFGADSVQEQRERYAEQRRSRSTGQSREVIWKKFRGAIENYLPKVRPGNQTALNTAASPFAAYLAVVHRQIHIYFADQFLRGLPMAGSPMSDPSLVTTLEIVINGDGSLETVGVARSSGFLPFDYGAFSSVQKAAPFPPPPTKILSSDGRAYMHWAFHRSERQCGTFNAQPYILKDVGPPTAPQPQDQGGGEQERPPSGPPPQPGEGELGWLRRERVLQHVDG
jgi:TonB family protein